MIVDNNELELLFKLAENDDLCAMLELVSDFHFNKKNNYRNSNNLTQEEILYYNKLIYKYLNVLIENGDCDSMSILGYFYYNGNTEFVEQDYTKAVYWFNEALKNKPLCENIKFENLQKEIYTSLGYCYFYDRIGKLDYKKAFLYLAKAAFMKEPNAMYKLGDMYKEGLYISKDFNKAFYWYDKAYRYSNRDLYNTASASLRLGRAYLEGIGTEISYIKALSYLQIAERKIIKMLFNDGFLNDKFGKELLKTAQELQATAREKLNNQINEK